MKPRVFIALNLHCCTSLLARECQRARSSLHLLPSHPFFIYFPLDNYLCRGYRGVKGKGFPSAARRLRIYLNRDRPERSSSTSPVESSQWPSIHAPPWSLLLPVRPWVVRAAAVAVGVVEAVAGVAVAEAAVVEAVT